MIKKTYKRIMAAVALFTLELVFVMALFLSCVILFFFLAQEMLTDQHVGFDQQVFNWATRTTTPLHTSLIKVITFFASRHFITSAAIMLIIYFLFVRKHHWYTLKVPVIAIGSISLNLVLKYLFDRQRPLIPHLAESSGLSFPSGHAMISASFYGLLIYLVWVNIASKFWRVLICSLLFLFILLIGYSRVYLKVHYASDVLAGFAAGFIWVILAIYALRRIEKYSRRNLDPVVEAGPSDGSDIMSEESKEGLRDE